MSKECVTHHYACDCREEDFKKALAACVEYRAKLDKLERENAALRNKLAMYEGQTRFLCQCGGTKP
jgi:cell shape-determining protein MreC